LCGCGFTATTRSTVAGFAVWRALAYLELHQVRRVDTRIARGTEPALGITDSPAKRRERNVAQRIRAEEFANLFRSIRRGNQFFARGCVHAVVAGGNRRRATDTHVDFFRANFADHADDFAAGGAANDGIIDKYHALAFDQAADGIEFELHPEITDGLRRLDEGTSNVVIADQAHAEGDFGFEGIADSRWHAGVRHRDDDVGVDRMFLGQEASEHLAALV